jgi:hypothetical protein
MYAKPTAIDPIVPVWRLNILRLFYAMIALLMGNVIWRQLIFGSANWPPMTGAAKALLAALSLLCLLGLRYPLAMLPMLIFEIAWKTIWMALIAYPAWANGRMTPGVEGLFWECSPVFVMYLIMPWRYIWHHYAKPRGEAWR